jgi:1,4-dihydroxy-2-naphthoate octaprenyltransferase
MAMDIAMWGKALRVIPRVSKKEWQKLDPIAKWLIASRSAVFIMTAFSAGVGGLLAARDGQFHWIPFLLCLFGLVFAHATNNLLNDYTDSVKGVDKDNYFRTIYGPQTLEHGLWSKQTLLSVIALSAALAAICGLILVTWSGIQVLWVTLVGAFFVLFYTWPLKYIGLGEPAVLAVWGPLMVGGTYLAITGTWSWEVAAIGAVYALGPTTVLFGKHTDKLTEDKKKKIHTLPVILGEPAARASVIAMIVGQPLLVMGLITAGVLSPVMLVVLFGLPMIAQTVQVFSQPRPTSKPKGFPDEAWPTYLVGYAFRCNRVTGSLFVLGLILDVIVRWVG